MNVQVLTDPAGRLVWASDALPGGTHDLTAARTRGIPAALAADDIKCGATRRIRAPVPRSAFRSGASIFAAGAGITRDHGRSAAWANAPWRPSTYSGRARRRAWVRDGALEARRLITPCT
ncbi:hypothetical protein [Streptomyces achmelvichensis]|uniref:hypothetical protein n=1 Tax=Streptomyces achmelvichensis TaxID=3134111 RepID=UPI003C12C2E2